jgi:predicted site-specific integrase-resolvase
MTLRRWVRDGLLKTYRKALDRRTYVDREELLALLKDPPVEER